MIDLTRRNFLGTLVAAPAAYLLPSLIIEAAERLVPAAVGQRVRFDGKLTDILFQYESKKPLRGVGAGGIFRADGTPLLHAPFTAQANYQWVAPPGHELVVTKEEPLGLYMEKVPGAVGRITAFIKRGEKFWRFEDDCEYLIPLDPADKPIRCVF